MIVVLDWTYFLWLSVLTVIGAGISLLPLLDDPFHREGKVCFWTWLYRELDEELHGEK